MRSQLPLLRAPCDEDTDDESTDGSDDTALLDAGSGLDSIRCVTLPTRFIESWYCSSDDDTGFTEESGCWNFAESWCWSSDDTDVGRTGAVDGSSPGDEASSPASMITASVSCRQRQHGAK